MLGLVVIGLLSANFMVAHQLSEVSRLRFVGSGLLLGGTSFYFRVGARRMAPSSGRPTASRPR